MFPFDEERNLVICSRRCSLRRTAQLPNFTDEKRIKTAAPLELYTSIGKKGPRWQGFGQQRSTMIFRSPRITENAVESVCALLGILSSLVI